MPVPFYLSEIADNVSEKKNFTYFTLKCSCGCSEFQVFRSTRSAAERKAEKPYYDALAKLLKGGSMSMTVDEQGTKHHWKHTLLKTEEVFLPPKPVHCSCTVIMIKCSRCGRERILFDSRYNGYDGKFCEELTSEERDYKPLMKPVKFSGSSSMKLRIAVENESYAEFCENTGISCSAEDYSEGYSWITVHAFDDSGKKRKLLDLETS